MPMCQVKTVTSTVGSWVILTTLYQLNGLFSFEWDDHAWRIGNDDRESGCIILQGADLEFLLRN
jgi:hypothetical protein